MSVTAVSSSTTSASVSTATSTNSSISSTEFLQLLVEELENQSPLDPTDTSSFISQMMSYASFSQQSELNSQLASMVSSFNSLLTSNAVGYLGRTVEATGDTATLADGQASWGYSLSAEASDVTITVKDSSGDAVWSGTGETSSGKHTFTWDGTSSDGTQLADGDQYTIEISATDSSGTSVYGYTTTIGTVDGVDSSSGTTMLDINGVSVSLEDVLAVKS
jgi:flagellar basal-body rod modification protein FlgD